METNEPSVSASGETQHAAASKIEEIAKTAVDHLGVAEAIRRESEREGSDSLFTRIEECDTFAEAAPVNSDMMFLALSLPIANGLIYFATNRERLRRAREWAARNWPGQDDPISTLAALTLIYIVKSGWRTFKSDPEKAPIWSRINTRVEKLKQDSVAATPRNAA
jgi:hypothetical protein